jgi:glyoxylase-like metal-dependent hydrolase (beta-lactamase superfamily II)
VARSRFIVDEVAAGTWRINDGVANFYLRKDGGTAIVVDAGCRGSARGLAIALRLAGLKVENVVAVLLTHAHIDHVGVAERVRKRANATVYVHPDDEPMTRCRNGGRLRGTVTLLGMDWGLKTGWELYRGHCFPYPRIAETGSVDDGEMLDLPGSPRVISLPGHTAGSVAFLFEGSSTLFSGDALTTYTAPDGSVTCRGVSVQYDEDPGSALESMDRLDGVQAGLILPGHGPDFTEGVPRAVSLARAEAASAE